MSKALKVPRAVRQTVCTEWPKNREYAAKQVAIWLLEALNLENKDQDGVVDVLLEIGMLAEKQKHGTADAFLNAVEEKFRSL